MSKEFLYPIIYLIVLCFGIRMRLSQEKKLSPYVDIVLIFQVITVIMFFHPFLKHYRFAPIILSFFTGILMTLVNNKKTWKERILVLLIIVPPFISLLSKLEHWWWATHFMTTQLLSITLFSVLLFRKSKVIKEELPYLTFFFFDMILGMSLFFAQFWY